MTFDDLVEFSNIVKDLDSATTTQKNSANWVINNQNTIKSKIPNIENYDSWSVLYNTYQNYYYYKVRFWQGGEFNNWNQSGTSDLIKNSTSSGVVSYYSYNGRWGNDGSNSYMQFCLFSDSIAQNVDFGNRIGNNYYITFKLNSDLEDVYVNGYDYKALSVSYIRTYTKIGYLSGVTDGMHFFNMSLSYTDNYSGEVIYNTKLYSTNSSSDLYMDDNYNIYVKNRLLLLNQPYVLYVDAYNNSTYDNLLGSANLRLFSVASNAVITNGVITYSGDSYYTQQDSTNDLIASEQEQTDKLLDNSNVVNIVNDFLFTSGDSGERFVAFGYVDYDNPYTDFITRTMFDITNVLISSGNVNYTLGFHDDEHITLHSDEFYLPNGPLKVFINSAIIFFVVYKIYGKMKMYIDSIAEGDILYTLEWKDGKWNEYIFF